MLPWPNELSEVLGIRSLGMGWDPMRYCFCSSLVVSVLDLYLTAIKLTLFILVNYSYLLYL